MPEPTNHRRQARQRRRRAPAFAVVALLGLSALAYSAWSLSASKTAYSSTGGSALSAGQTAAPGTSSAAATSGAATSAPATSSAPATTGVPPQPVGPVALNPGSPSQVAAWKAGSGGTTLAEITANVGTVLMTHDARQFVQMKRVCVSLAAEVKTAGSAPAIPDPAMQNMYDKALASLAAGAANCQAAVSSHQEGDEDLITSTNSSVMATAMSQLDVGTRDLYIATWKIKALKKS